MVAQGAVGGVMSVLQGGKFGHGFAAAGFSKLASPFLPNTPFSNGRTDFGQIVAAAVIGGTASEISGGKFANGAITGAFVNLFNQQRALGKQDRFENEQQAKALGGAARKEYDVISSLNVDEMAERFPELQPYTSTASGRTYISTVQGIMERDLQRMYIRSLTYLVEKGALEVVNQPFDMALGRAWEAYDVYSTVSTEIYKAGWFRDPITVQIGCGVRSGCNAAIYDSN